MSYMDGVPQKRMTFRLTDPAGFLVMEFQGLFPAPMVQGIQTDWVNRLILQSPDPDSSFKYRLDVVLK